MAAILRVDEVKRVGQEGVVPGIHCAGIASITFVAGASVLAVEDSTWLMPQPWRGRNRKMHRHKDQ